MVALTDLGGSAFASYRHDAFGRDLGALAPGGGSVSAELATEIAFRQPLGCRWKGIHHVGIVEWVSTKNRVRTIEGNTSNGAVARRRRHAADIAGHGYPKYR